VILAIIPARGGSRGIPDKNLQEIEGVPLVVNSIRHALRAELVDRVIVSTDSARIGAVAREAGAEVVHRPPELAGDTASSESALLHVLRTVEEAGGEQPELVVFLQATSPIRRPRDIDGAIRLLVDGGYDSVFSASPAHGFVWAIGVGQPPTPLTYDPVQRPRRQEIGEHVAENGSIYVLKPWVLRETGLRLGGRIGVYRMGFFEGLQVDTPEDLELARWIVAHGMGPGDASGVPVENER